MHRIIVALGLLLTAACEQQGPDEQQVLEQADRLVKPLPGLYRSTTTLTGFELPGADPRVAGRTRERFGLVSPQRREFCLSVEEANRGFEGLVEQTQSGDCAVERFVANNTRLSARMTCNAGTALTSTVSIEGTGAPDRSHIVLEIVQSGPSIPGGKETITMEIENVRVGDCPKGTPGG